MLQTIEAVIDEKGILRIPESIELPKMRPAIVLILDTDRSEKEINYLAARYQKIIALEQQHAQGYTSHPTTEDEFPRWQDRSTRNTKQGTSS